MRFVAPLLAAALAAVTPIFAAPTTEVSRTPPPLYAEHLAAQLTPLAAVMDGRSAFPGDDGGGIILLHEKVVFQGDDGLIYRVLHMVQYAVDQSGAERLGSDIYSFDREREDIFLIDAATIRADGERMPVEGKGAFIQTPQHEAENSLYTSEAELNIIFPRVAPGSVTEAIVLIREHQPVMPGEFALSQTFARGWPAHRHRLVLDFPDTVLRRVKAVTTGSGVPEPVSERYGADRERRSWVRDGAPRIRWEESGPQFEFRGPTLWLTTLESWDAVATWFHGLLAERSDLGSDLAAEVDRWTESVTDRREILARLTEKVANDVRYVGLEFGLAGYQPHACREVWDARYGDCKDKANLLRAMLAHKGIPAHVVLLQTSGPGRVQVDSPSWRQFNHAILAVEEADGGYTFCDPTIKYLPAGSIGLSDIARDVLVVKPGRAVWARTPDPMDSAIRVTGDLALATDGALSGWLTLTGEGADAAGYAHYLNGMDRDGRLRWMQRLTEGFFPGADVVDIDYAPVDGAVTKISIRAYFTRGARASGDQALVFPYPSHWLPKLDTSGERRFPYVTIRREESVAVSIALPQGWAAQAVPAGFSAPSDSADFQAVWTAAPDRLEARLAWHPKQSVLPAAEYATLQRSVRALTSWLEQPVVLEHRANGVAAVSATSEVSLEDFPILPTGQGQLRLLNDRYPEDTKPRQRRAALEKILQWFPNDTETAFEAKVLLASLDWDDAGNKVFADRMAGLIAQHGSQVNPGLRAWAVYLEARGRWPADKDATAIERLEQIADDKSLTPYRRGWSAVFAARFRRELDVRSALEFAQRHDDYESEAREAIVRLIASLYAELGDTTGLTAWCGELGGLAGEAGDTLLAAAIDGLIDGHARVSDAQRTTAVDAILAAAPDGADHPKVNAERVRWQQLVSRDAAVAAYRDTIRAWLEKNRPDWWTQEKSTRFTDMAAVIKHIDASNDGRNARETVDGAMQLVLHYDPAVNELAMYSRWAMWWLRKQEFSTELIDVVGRGVQSLPAEAGTEVIAAWHEYAVFLRAKDRLDEARAVYQRVLEHPAAKNYQRVDAGGELSVLERGAGNVEASLAAAHRIVPFHTAHKWSVNYLYPATILHIHRGEYDEALALIEAMRAQETEYIEGSDHSLVVQHLLRTARQPEALRRYWARTATWIESWNAILELNGVKQPAPHELPLERNLPAAGERVDKAAASKNIATFLRELDTFARLARLIPICGGDYSVQAEKAARISPGLAARVCAVGVTLLEGAEPVDPQFDESAAVWKSIMLGGMGRKDEAAACGREIFERLGAEHAQGMAGLRLWVLYTRETPDAAEVAAKLDAVLASDAKVPDRMMSARVLSDSYWVGKNPAAQRVLLEREMAREGFDPASAEGKVMTARLDELNKSARQGGELTAAINAWLEAHDAAWLDHVSPRALDEPRFAALKPPLLSAVEGVSQSEALKYNILAAREEDLPAETRISSFFGAVVDLAYQTNNAEQLVAVYLSAAAIKVLPDERRARFVYNAVNAVILRGDTALLEKLVGDQSFKMLHEDRRRSARAVLKALKLADAAGAAWETAALAAINDATMDDLRVNCLDHLVERLAYSGEFERATALVAAAKEAKIDTSFVDKSIASLRLGWTRMIRRVQEQFEFVRGARALLAGIRGSDAPVPDKIRHQMSFGANERLSPDEHFTEARYILDHGYLVGEGFASLALFALNDAQEVRRRNPMLFPQLLELAFTAPGPDQDRAGWVTAGAIGSDIDQPEVLGRVNAAIARFQKSSEAASRPQTAQKVALVRAYIALRTERQPRPAAIFGDLERNGVSENERRGLELHFLTTRGRATESVQVAESLPTDTLMQPQFFRLARNSLVVAGRADEVQLMDESMRERLERAMGDLWMHPARNYNWSWLYVARALEARDVVTDAWFDRAAQVCASDLARGVLRAHQAHLAGDWKALRQAADMILREVPDMYDAYYDRAVAKYHLGDKKGARDDLRVMLAHSLSHEDYQHALKLFREVAPGEKLDLKPKDGR